MPRNLQYSPATICTAGLPWKNERAGHVGRTALAFGKKSVQNADEMSIVEGLWEETLLCVQSIQSAPAQARMKRFIERGGQTREVELDMQNLVEVLGEADG